MILATSCAATARAPTPQSVCRIVELLARGQRPQLWAAAARGLPAVFHTVDFFTADADAVMVRKRTLAPPPPASALHRWHGYMAPMPLWSEHASVRCRFLPPRAGGVAGASGGELRPLAGSHQGARGRHARGPAAAQARGGRAHAPQLAAGGGACCRPAVARANAAA